MTPRLALFLSLFLWACSPEEDPQPPSVAGTYTVVIGSQEGWDNGCPVDVPLLDLMTFVGVQDVIVTGPMTVTQDGAAITVDFTGCTGLTGGVGAGGDLSFTGSCTPGAWPLDLVGTAIFTNDGGIRSIDGELQVAVDWNDAGDTGTPDGDPDCTVTGDLLGSF